jgi:hypothetical protein
MPWSEYSDRCLNIQIILMHSEELLCFHHFLKRQSVSLKQDDRSKSDREHAEALATADQDTQRSCRCDDMS